MSGISAITIATSIMPRRIEAQQAAISSWQQLGFNVVSLNRPGEIDDLVHAFPDVLFFKSAGGQAAEDGFPYVRINELLDALASFPGEVGAIVNSDVSLAAGSDLHSFMGKHAENSMVFGPRIDVMLDDLSVNAENPYGFDFFFFSKKVLATIPCSDFYLGLPWWDYWLPLATASRGCKLKRLMSPVAYHLSHELGWSEALLEKYWHIMKGSISSQLESIERCLPSVADALDNDMHSGAEILRTILNFGTESLFLPGAGSSANLVSLNEETFEKMKSRLVAIEQRNAENERTLAAIYSTKSWRFTEPLRRVKRIIRNLSN